MKCTWGSDMKIRNGFISNSSSSSFIIAQNGRYTPENVKERVVEVLKQIQKSRIKNIRREAQDAPNTEEYVKMLKNYYNRNTYAADEVNKWLTVQYIKVAKVEHEVDLNYWFAGKDLEDDNIIVYDNCSNYIPSYAVKRIVKEFGIADSCYQVHM